jgi:EPS-associated MarR family transcriptional regulator
MPPAIPAAMSPDEVLTYQALRRLAHGPLANQRSLADALGVSLGKANYVARALLDKGLVKLENVSRNPNRLGYLYALTPKGVKEKARLTQRFLKRKIEEYEVLQAEIAVLQSETRSKKPTTLAQ